jgi:hypothetical protein
VWHLPIIYIALGVGTSIGTAVRWFFAYRMILSLPEADRLRAVVAFAQSRGLAITRANSTQDADAA